MGKKVGGFDELCSEFRAKRDGLDCVWNVIVSIPEARGLRGLAGHGFNDVKVKVSLSNDPDLSSDYSGTHAKTTQPLFDEVFKINFQGQPSAFFESFLTIELLHDRGILPAKLIGLLQIGIIDIYLSKGHMVPMQWFPIVDVYSDEPAIPTGYVRLNCIINTMDEPGAVQSDVPEEERSRFELFEVPRIHACVTATGMYNIIFRVYRARDLRVMDDMWGSSDPFVRVVTPTGENKTDTRSNDLNPVWNQQLQIPIYEPSFRQIFYLDVTNDGLTGPALMGRLLFSWKDIWTRKEQYKQAHWYDIYALPDQNFFVRTRDSIKRAARNFPGPLRVKKLPGFLGASGGGSFEEPNIYVGRVLLGIEIEDREGGKQPSLAATDMKAKDCNFFKDVMQKVFFRMQIFQAQGIVVPTSGVECYAQVEVTIGRSTMTSKPVSCKKPSMGLFEWYQAIEMEQDFLYDDNLWKWTREDYEAGRFPTAFIDEGVPDVWIRVYKCNGVLSGLGETVNAATRSLVGFHRCTLRDLLAIGDPEKEPWEDMQGSRWMEHTQMNNEKRNVILNRKDSSLPAFALGASENLPDEFNPLKGKAFRPSWEHPPWPSDSKYDDGRGNTTSMDPYTGLRCIDLMRDNTCATDPQVPVGFLWVSFKAYLPSRAQCDSARKGPPILSPFVKYNQVPIPTPEQLKCMTRFALRLHIFQAKDLPAANSDGLAHAKVVVHFCGRKLATHVLARTNSPTWDTTLSGAEFMEIDVPCLGWPGNGEGYEDPFEDGKPRSYKFLARKDDEELWEANYNMLIAAPRIEVRVVEEVNGAQVALGRCFIKPEECSHSITDPEWRELFKGNPEVDEGQILLSAQMVHEKDPQYKRPCAELAPIHDGGKEVVMRECRIVIQILGLRGMAKSLNLNNPRVYAYVQTTDRWDGDPKSVFKGKQSKRPSPEDCNFMETAELQVLLPDHLDFQPDLEFIVEDTTTWGSKKIVAWGSVPLSDMYPQGVENEDDEEDGDDEEDEAAHARAEKLRRKNQFKQLLEELSSAGTITATEAKRLERTFNKEVAEQAEWMGNNPGLDPPKGPMTQAFELFLNAPSDDAFIQRAESFLLSSNKKALEQQQKRDEKKAEEKEKKEKKEREKAEAKQRKEDEKRRKESLKQQQMEDAAIADMQTAEGWGDAAVDGPDAGPAPVEADGTGVVSPEDVMLGSDVADAGPSNMAREAGDNPEEAANPSGPPDCDPEEADAVGGAAYGGGDAADDNEYTMVLPEDDDEPDKQVVVDTPDGKPTAEWLVLRKHEPYKVPLEETPEWGHRIEDLFDEVHLFSGKIRDGKRKVAEKIGLLKCQISIFRREDEAANGKSKKYPDRMPKFYHVVQDDLSVEAGLDMERPYNPSSIYENFPEASVEVRVYVIKAFQITPGGLEREEAGKKVWEHIVTADLGEMHQETEVVRALNPKMFHTFIFKNQVLPGPSQLVLGLKDVKIFNGQTNGEVLIGETTVDLEDRWFCKKWQMEKYKPREVRDLYNEDRSKGEMGVSQGKLSIIVDVVDQNKADEQPAHDIQVLGKTQNMELRMMLWNTHETACKDTYTSDVYISCELMGVGQPKQTDVHYGVKKGAYGMFNWRLKWRTKYPSTSLEYLMRIQIWDDNLLGSHASIAEGILPLGPLFKECFDRNQGKTSPDDMEDVWLIEPGITGTPDQSKKFLVDEDGVKNPTIWYTLLHPNEGFNPAKDSQCKLQMSLTCMPRAKARAAPAGAKRNGPSKMPEPGRPPQPANPLLYPEKCKAYIVYSCKEFFSRCKGPCLCCLCCLLLAAIIGAVAGLNMAFPGA